MVAPNDEPLRIELHEGVLWLTFNRPATRNSMNQRTRKMIIAALTDAHDPAVRAVVFQGDEKAFSSGGDIGEMGGSVEWNEQMLRASGEVVSRVAELPKPVIAAVRGNAAGAGMSLAFACDFVFADTTALFTSGFVKLGLVPDMTGTYWLPRHVGLQRAKEVLLGGREIGAGEALSLGLVSEVWQPEDFEANLAARVAALAAGPTLAIGAIKRLLHEALGNDLTAQIAAEERAQAVLHQTDDHREGVAAFTEKRAARFTAT